MKAKNPVFTLLAVTAVLALGGACGSLTSTTNVASNTSAPNATAPNAVSNTSGTSNTTAGSTSTIQNPGLEKADFTVTAEELDKEYTREGVTDKDLEKYESKNIAVTGRVSMLVTEKKGTTQPWVTLYAPGTLHGVSCYFDDDNVEQMKLLKMDKVVKVQGFQDDFIVPEISPRLEHCRVLEAN